MPLRAIDLLVIHCADVPNGRHTTAAEIDRWHLARGFRRDPRLVEEGGLRAIGYHFVIYTTGEVVPGRGIGEIGAHVAGHNEHSLGVCLIGRDAFSLAQWAALSKTIEMLVARFPRVHIAGHRELNPAKTCPGFDVQAWLAGGRAPLAGHIFTQEAA